MRIIASPFFFEYRFEIFWIEINQGRFGYTKNEIFQHIKDYFI